MCDQLAKYRYTWPGQDESFICEKHAPKLKGISQVMGFYLQLIPLSEVELLAEKLCDQK